MSISVNDFSNKKTLKGFLEFIAKELDKLPDDVVFKTSISLEPIHATADKALSDIVTAWNKAQVLVPDKKIIGG